MRPDLAVFAATSGHSGVDRLLGNLVPAVAGLGLGIDLLGIRRHGPHWGALPAGVRYVDLGSRHVTTALPALVRYLRRRQPRALLTDKDRVNRIALIARRLARADTRLAVRSGTTLSVDLRARPWLDRWMQTVSVRHIYRWADAVLVPSEGAARDLAEYARLPPARVRVVPSPLVGPELATRAAEPVDHPWFQPGGPPVILGSGELCARKDFATLVRAHARLRPHLDTRLVILGRGGEREALLRLAARLGSADHVDLPGFVANPFAYMARAAVLALSSRWEGFGNVLVEAMAVGCPVVATDCPSGPREILDGGRLGPLVAVGDDEAMAGALLKVLRRPQTPEALRAAVRRYTVEESTRAYLEALGLPVLPGARPSRSGLGART
jgi:glycosyltransferase involved in cell wall biosynthesis